MIRTTSRLGRLQSFTSEGDLLEELSAYLENSFVDGNNSFTLKDLEDEPMVVDWEQYNEETKVIGVYEALKHHLVQFRFPIQENISQSNDYRNATLKGHSTELMQEATGLFLTEPDKLKLILHPSLAGRIPVIIANNRFDFQAIVRALTYRNEPRSMPDSMGAAMINGLNNWDRLRKSIQRLSKEEAFANKALYQDRIIVLSKIPYSNVTATEMNLDREDWLEISLSIRLQHECAHYFTLRQFGIMSNNMHDEVIADYMGICSVLPLFNSRWFLQFVGLADYPNFKESGRIKNYLGDPPLSNGAFEVLRTIVKLAACNIEKFDKVLGTRISTIDSKFRIVALSLLSLTDLACEDGVVQLLNAHKKLHDNI